MALTDSLVSHWAMNEASGNALDSFGSNTLTETSGTIDSAVGKVGNCRDFEAGDTEYFELADNASLSTGDIDFTFACWINFESIATFPVIFSKSVNSGNQREYMLFCDTGVNRLIFRVSSNGTATTDRQATTLGAPTTATWYFVVCWHDSVNNTLNIQVNNGTADSTSYSSGVFDSTAPFQIGAQSSVGIYFDGLIDEVSFWKRVLTAPERTTLYNSGAGLAYPWTSLPIGAIVSMEDDN